MALPDTKVLAIASHVVYGYVGNTMATFVMQALGCEVAAINTVNFSNHTGYRQWTGTKTPASEIQSLYDGLKQSYLTDFQMLLSGYAATADAVETIGKIARDLRYRSSTRPGGFFWILDPVMGDQGKLYVAEDIVPAYKNIIREADLILPNQFEAELLSGVTILSLSGVVNAIGTMHTKYRIRHIVVTSVRFDEHRQHKNVGEKSKENEESQGGEEAGQKLNNGLTVVGSSMKSDGSVRCFRISIPKIDCFFSGTGDMFAALMVARLREECAKANLLDGRGWISPDDVNAVDLPLAKATEKVLSSMQMVLEKTWKARHEEMARWERGPGHGAVDGQGDTNGEAKRRHLAESKAAEVRVVKYQKDLIEPQSKFRAEPMDALGGAE